MHRLEDGLGKIVDAMSSSAQPAAATAKKRRAAAGGSRSARQEEDNTDDSDGEDAPPRTRKRFDVPKRRTSAENQLAVCAQALFQVTSLTANQSDVRQHALFLLKRKTAKSPFPMSRIATESQIEAFRVASHARKDRGCCTAKKFILDFANTARSEWNVCAAEVFATSFISRGTYECTDKPAITQQFLTHLRTLQNHCRTYGTQEDRLHEDIDELEPPAIRQPPKRINIWGNDEPHRDETPEGKKKAAQRQADEHSMFVRRETVRVLATRALCEIDARRSCSRVG